MYRILNYNLKVNKTEKIFVENFIKDKYKERILYELSSKKPDKKERAFTKLLEYDEYLRNDVSKIDLSHLTKEEIASVISNRFKNKYCYSLKFNCKVELVKGVINTINSYMLDILVIDENNIIYIGEVEHHKDGGNASVKYIFYR